MGRQYTRRHRNKIGLTMRTLLYLALLGITLQITHGAGCAPDQFVCGSGDCVDRRGLCDDSRDCPDGEDEKHCSTICSYYFHSAFACGWKCLNTLWVCDGEPDCASGEDEASCGSSAAEIGGI